VERANSNKIKVRSLIGTTMLLLSMTERGLRRLPLLRSVSVSMKAVHKDRLEGEAAPLTTETMSTGGREVFLLKK
jgi:hypothetical protein